METSSAEGRFLRAQLEVAQAALSSLQADPLMQTLLDTICQAQDYRAMGFIGVWSRTACAPSRSCAGKGSMPKRPAPTSSCST